MVRTFVSTCLFVAAAGVFTAGAWAADAAAGKTLYATKCKSCHGADGTPPAGMMKAFSTLKPLSDPSIQGKSDADLVNSITKGYGKMKPQSVSAGDAENLVAFMRTIK
jgi:mono/diheme cytochrome c family protein